MPPSRDWNPKWETNYIVAPLSMQKSLQSEGIKAPTGRGYETFYARTHAVRGTGEFAKRAGLPSREMGIYPVQVDRRLQDPKRHPQQAGWARRLPVFNHGSLGPSRVGDPTPHPSNKQVGKQPK